jgi:hypothetical protein
MTPLPSCPKSARFVPRCESLEERCVPAIKIQYLSADPRTVQILGDPGKAGLIRIFDNGSANPGAIKVYELLGGKPTGFGALGGPMQLRGTVPGTIRNLWVITFGKGNDRVEYIGSGANLTTERSVLADLRKGKGKDTFFAALIGTTLQPGSNLGLRVLGGQGSDTVTLQMGATRIRSSAGLFVQVTGGAASKFVTIANAGLGVTADPQSQVTFLLDGGSKDNDIRVYLQGFTLYGQLQVQEVGHAGDDNLWFTLNTLSTLGGYSAISTGALSVVLDGGPGNNQFTLDVFPPGSALAPVDTAILWGPGGNSFAYTNTKLTTVSPGLAVFPEN